MFVGGCSRRVRRRRWEDDDDDDDDGSIPCANIADLLQRHR